MLYGLCLLPLVLIAARLLQLQQMQQLAYREHFLQLRDVWETLPARDGRLLAADGTVLADEIQHFDLAVHYRWLEEPVDRRWLRRKAWEQLSRAERRQPALVAAKEQQFLGRRERLWSELNALAGRTEHEREAIAREIQIRVERIWENVNARRESRLVTSAPETTDEPRDLTGWLSASWDLVCRELTQPPERVRLDPLVIQEQEAYHVLWRDIPAAVAQHLAAHPEQFPGIRVQTRSQRIYPQRELAAHLLGVRTGLGKSDAADSITAHQNQSRGRTGLELQYDHLLSGRPGRQLLRINRHGEVAEQQIPVPPQHGQDVVLTLDLTLQRRAEELLDQALQSQIAAGDDAAPEAAVAEVLPQGGCLVALDVRTGAVLAAASAPRFDANLLVSGSRAEWDRVVNDPRKPFFPRLTQMALAPGSVFKTLTSVALLEAGAVSPDSTIACVGYLERPEQHRCLIFRHHGFGHGTTDLSQALCQSCNVYFFAGARRSGPEPLVEWARRFGIGSPTGIDLPGEVAGTLPNPVRIDDGARSRWHLGETLGLSIGQSSLTTTPLQIARMMAAVANGGQLVRPHLATTGGPTTIEATAGDHVRPVFAHPDPQPIADLHAETLQAIRVGLTRVVHDPSGTGYKTVRLREVSIAGKTGTAEVGNGRPDHAWFAGFVPAEQPRVAIVVVLEHGGSGGKNAGPLAREFVRSLLDVGLIASEHNVAER